VRRALEAQPLFRLLHVLLGDRLRRQDTLAVDPPRRALFACSAMIPEMEGFRAEDKGRSSLFQYDLATGKLTRTLALTGPGKGHVCNDLAVDEHGGILVSDSLSGTIYTANPGDTALTPLVPPGLLKSPQGIAVAPDGRTLLGADTALHWNRQKTRLRALQAPPLFPNSTLTRG